MGATASGSVTFMRVFSSLIPSTCFIACLLFAWTNFKLPRFVRHSCSYYTTTHANEKERCVALAAKRAATIRWPHAMAD